MALYEAPEGYEFDTNTGLYYTQTVAEDEYGNRSQVVTWFDADTGKYSQNTYAIEKALDDGQDYIPDGYIGRASGFTTDPYSQKVGSSVSSSVENFTGEIGRKVSAWGQDIASKAKSFVPESFDFSDEDGDEDYYAYTAYDKQGNPKQADIIRRILYAVKRFVNKSPVWMKFIPLAVLLFIDLILAMARPDEVSEVRCSFLLGFVAIPFLIVHLIDLKRKYEAKALMIVQPVLLVVIGLLMMPSVIAVSFGIMKDAWLVPGVGPVFLWYLCVTLGYVLTYFMVKKRFQKISLPMVELWTTVMLVGMASVWVGVLAMWILALVIFVVMFVVVVPFMLKMALSSDNAKYKDQYGNLYDEFGNRIV